MPAPLLAQSKKVGRPRAFDRDVALNRALETFWKSGYEPTSVAELCKAMKINSPSLYLSFGNKAQLFLEAVEHYENRYWSEPWQILEAEPDIRLAVEKFLDASAVILTSPETPFGCVVVLSATNVSPDSIEVDNRLRELREVTRTKLIARFKRALKEKDLPDGSSAEALAGVFTAVLQGMSIQARDGASRAQLDAIAHTSLQLLPNSRTLSKQS